MSDGSTPASPESALSAPIVLYDGTCGLCHKTVRWLLEHEGDDALRFAPLQGETASVLRSKHPEIPTTVDTVVLVEDGHAYLRSKVFLHGAKHLRAPWAWAYYIRWFPSVVLDVLYRVVASLRYRIWGRADLCALPSPAERARFLP